MVDMETKKIQKEEPDLYKRSIKGSYWVIISRIVVTLLGFLKTLFIAHFFLLNDLGIIGAAVMMMEILNTFSQTGFETALIQKKGDIHDYLDTAWTAGIFKGVVLFLILFFAAPLMASFKIPAEKIPLAVSVFQAMSVCFLINSVRNIGAIYFNKNLEFHKTFVLSLVSTLSDIVLSIGFILIIGNLWGLIIARLLTACIGCVNTYMLSDYRPKLHFDYVKAKELWKFGRWIFGANVLGYILQAGDDYFVWFYLGIQPLALYQYAFKFAMMPTTHISYVISQVSFPAYSKIQHDLPRLQEAYLKVMKVTALFSVPVAFLIFVLGPDFVHLFLPERMYPLVRPLQILALVGLITSMGSSAGPVFRAIAKVRPLLYFQWVRIILLSILIYPLTKQWGISGTALAIASVRLLIYFPSLFFASRLIKCPFGKLFQPLLLPFSSSTIMLITMILLKNYLVPATNYIWFFTLLFLGLGIYSIAAWFIDGVFNWGLKSIFKEQLKMIGSQIPRINFPFKIK